MADNVVADAGTGGATLAADDIGGIHFPRSKIVIGADGTNDGDVSSSNPLPISDAGGSITVDSANLVTLAGAVSGTEMQVDIVSAPTITVQDGGGSLTVDGTVSISGSVTVDLGANNDVTIDNSSIVKAEDAVHSTGDAGVMSLAVRNDTLAALAGTDGDYAPLQVNASGALYVHSADLTTLAGAVSGSEVQVDLVGIGGVATETTLGAIKTAVELIDNAISGTEMQVDIVSAPTITVADGGGSLTVDGSVSISGTVTVDLGANNDVTIDNSSIVHAEDTAHTTGDAGVMGLAVRQDSGSAIAGTDGDYSPLQVDSSGNLRVNVAAGSSSGTEFNEDAAHASGAAGPMVLGVRRDADTSPVSTDGDYHSMIFDDSGNLKVNIKAGSSSGTEYAVDTALGATPTGTLAIAIRDDALSTLTPVEGDGIGLRVNSTGALWVHSADLTTLAGAVSGSEMQVDIVSSATINVADGGGSLTVDGSVSITGSLPTGSNTIGDVTVSGAALTALQLIDDAVYVDDADWTDGSSKHLLVGGLYQSAPQSITDGDVGPIQIDSNGNVIESNSAAIKTAVELIDNAISGNEMQVDVVAALPAGTNAIGKLAANSGVDIGDVDVTSIAAGTNVIGDVGVSGTRTSGGTTLYRNVDVDETEDQVKASAGQVYWIQCTNIATSVMYLQLYNATAANVTVGTTTPDLTFAVPTAGSANGAGFVFSIPNGVAFSTAITVAATTTPGGASGPGANEVILAMGYA